MSRSAPDGQPSDPPGGDASSAQAPEGDLQTNWKPVYAAIAIAVALTLATVLWINRPQAEVSGPTPSPIATQATSFTPTPDPREAEIAAAQEVYERYAKAILNMGKAGGAKKATEKVHSYTTGRNWEAVKVQAARIRKESITITGEPRAHYNGVSDIKLSQTPPSLLLRVCLDQSNLTVRDKSGKKRNPAWIRSDVTMVQTDDRWQITERNDREEQRSCID